LFVCCLLVGTAFASPRWDAKRTMQKLKQRMQRLAAQHPQALQQNDMELQGSSCSSDDLLQLGTAYNQYLTTCPNDPNTKNSTCDVIYSTADFCGSTCPAMQSALFNLILNLGCEDYAWTPCSSNSQCSNGDGCYLGYCQTSCVSASDCNDMCDPSQDGVCNTASTSGSVKVCQDPYVTTKADYHNQLVWQINAIINQALCFNDGNGLYCNDVPDQYPDAQNVTCPEAVALGCCAGFLYRSYGVCTKGAATTALMNLKTTCTQVNWDGMCTNEVPLCPATGGTDPLPGSSAMAVQPFGLMVLALSFAMLFR